VSDETTLQRLRSGGRMFGAVFQGLFGLAFGLFFIVFGIQLGIAIAAQPWPLAIPAGLLLALPIALFGGFIAYHALKIPITLWRDRRTPLPAMDGSPVVIARKQPRRLWRTLGYGALLVLIPIVFVANQGEMELPLLSYLPVAFVTLGLVIVLVRVWFPPRLYWEPIVLDGEGIDDRSLGRGRIPWRDVLDVTIGALASGNGTLLKLTTPPKRLPGVTIVDIGFLPILDRMTQGRRYLIIRTHGLELHNERAFRLIHAYWRTCNGRTESVISRTAR
jgi:hypothetical protein